MTDRGQLLWRLADLMEAHADELAEIESLDNGRPVAVARAGDIPLAIDMFRYMAGMAAKVRGSTLNLSSPGDYHSYVLREPVGVVGQIIPWNFLLPMAAWKLAPALTVGCTAVLKPAGRTPLSALRLGGLIGKAGFPPGVANIVPGFGETAGAALANHPDVDKVGFTGSMEVVREEIFGPVLVASRYGDDDLDRIASQANDTTYGLAGSIWINCHNVFDASLPFGSDHPWRTNGARHDGSPG